MILLLTAIVIPVVLLRVIAAIVHILSSMGLSSIKILFLSHFNILIASVSLFFFLNVKVFWCSFYSNFFDALAIESIEGGRCFVVNSLWPSEIAKN